jgi:7-carboxy-7-deazaguanine synthase
MRVAVETQGQLFPHWLPECDVLTFSPKGPSSGNEMDMEEIQALVEFLQVNMIGTRRRNQVCIKIVCFDEADFHYALTIYHSIPPLLYDAFYFTAGTDINAASPFERQVGIIQTEQWLSAQMLSHHPERFNEKVHLGCQVHALLWPDKDKGV